MLKIKNAGLDQYGAEPFEQQQFGTAGVEGVKTLTLDPRHIFDIRRVKWYGKILFQYQIVWSNSLESNFPFITVARLKIDKCHWSTGCKLRFVVI